MELSRTSGTITLSASKVSSDTRERSKRRVDSSQTLSAPPSLERSTVKKAVASLHDEISVNSSATEYGTMNSGPESRAFGPRIGLLSIETGEAARRARAS